MSPFSPYGLTIARTSALLAAALVSLWYAAQASLAWWSAVSPFSPYGPTIALIFVLLVAAAKAVVEDRKRHREDRITNNSTAHVVAPDGVPCKNPVLAAHIICCVDNAR